MAQPVWESVTVDSVSGTAVAPAKPTSLADGDFVYLTLARDGTQAITPPSGFTEIANADAGDNVFRIWRKHITNAAGEPSTYSISWTGAEAAVASANRISNVNTTTPEDLTPTVNTGTGVTATCTGLTTVNNDCLLFAFVGAQAGHGAAIAHPSGMTERFDHQAGSGGAAARSSEAGATVGQATAGATGDKVFTLVLSGHDWGCVLVPIRSADEGGGATIVQGIHNIESGVGPQAAAGLNGLLEV